MFCIVCQRVRSSCEHTCPHLVGANSPASGLVAFVRIACGQQLLRSNTHEAARRRAQRPESNMESEPLLRWVRFEFFLSGFEPEVDLDVHLVGICCKEGGTGARCRIGTLRQGLLREAPGRPAAPLRTLHLKLTEIQIDQVCIRLRTRICWTFKMLRSQNWMPAKTGWCTCELVIGSAFAMSVAFGRSAHSMGCRPGSASPAPPTLRWIPTVRVPVFWGPRRAARWGSVAACRYGEGRAR